MYSTAVFESGATLCQSRVCHWVSDEIRVTAAGRAAAGPLAGPRGSVFDPNGASGGPSPTRGKSAGDLTYPRCHTENLPPHVRCDGLGRSPRPHVLGNQTALSMIKAQGFRSRDRVGQSRVDPRRTTPRVVSH